MVYTVCYKKPNIVLWEYKITNVHTKITAHQWKMTIALTVLGADISY